MNEFLRAGGILGSPTECLINQHFQRFLIGNDSNIRFYICLFDKLFYFYRFIKEFIFANILGEC